ncbi:MAG TPA: phage baseplate assembly protein V, partial [Longimicrobium sp.]|nr:phage baseplate assembly protein V [Longimicrobium sp.]
VNAGMKGALYQASEKRDHRFHGIRKAPETLGGAATLVAAVERGSTKAAGGGDPGVLAFTSRTPTLADARAALQRESARTLGNAVAVEGRSTRPALRAGERIEVGEGETWRLPTTGAFGLVEVVHRWDGQQYENAFRATPFAAYRAPEAPSASPLAGVATAIVVANDDSGGMGRVRVRYPWMGAEERSGWVRTSSVYAGNTRGVGFLPEVGDEVVVGFEQGDTERPLVLGSLWNGADKAGHAPGTKQIQTKAGNTIRLEEAGGAEAVELYSAGGSARMRLANGGTPTVTVVVKGDMAIEAANEVVLKAGRLVQNVKGDASKQISGALTHKVNGTSALEAQTVDVQASTGGATLQATAGNLTLQAGGTFTANGVEAKIQPSGHVPQRVAPPRPRPPASAQQGRAVPAPAPPRTSGDARTPGGPGRQAARPAPRSTPCLEALVAAAPPRLREHARSSIPLLLDEAKAAGYSRDQAAYLLATAQHESGLGRTMTELRPHKDYEGRTDLGNTQRGDGLRFEGRGYVQITGRTNYADWGRRLGIDLIGHPELATVPANAAKIAVQGMKKGTFTGAKISRYINDTRTDFRNARRVINGTDKADLIAGYAEKYKTALGSCDDWK